MTGKIKDISGVKFNMLLVDSLAFTRNGYSHWNCVCDCGAKVVVRKDCLQSGNNKSCGCLKRKLDLEMHTNGCMDHPGAYASWSKMVARCTKKSHSAYPWYGGKGITVDESWMDFRNFVDDMGDRPEGYSIERIDNSLGYSKENCKWIPVSEQQWNTSANVFIEVVGVKMCIGEAARKYGIDYGVLSRRVKKGWPHDLAVSTPGTSCKKYKHGVVLPDREGNI